MTFLIDPLTYLSTHLFILPVGLRQHATLRDVPRKLYLPLLILPLIAGASVVVLSFVVRYNVNFVYYHLEMMHW